MFDLHTHSRVSDGSHSPSYLVEEAARRGISVLALTDHDTTNGLSEAAEAAEGAGIRFIPGIELEIRTHDNLEQIHASGEFHLLGLGINWTMPSFAQAVDELAERREERNIEIVEKMNLAGINCSYDEIKVFALGPDSGESKAQSIGRLHFAEFLVKNKIAKNLDQAFKRYLGKGKPLFVPKAALEFEKAAELIHKSGGIAVLAHPMSLYVAWGKLPDFLQNLKDRGLDGIEAWHPNAKVGSCKRLAELAKKLELCITAGSDFHGEKRPDRKLGVTAGGRKIDESLVSCPFTILAN